MKKKYEIMVIGLLIITLPCLLSCSMNEIQNEANVRSKITNSSSINNWEFYGIEVCQEDYDQKEVRICSDGSNGAVIIWRDFRRNADDYDIYAQRVDFNGSKLWTTNGILVCENVSYPTAIWADIWGDAMGDGMGGAFVTWHSNYDIYAQHISPEGNLNWEVNGKPICMQGDNQYYPKMCSDGSGGIIITWEDRRGSAYAQRIDADGNIKWTPNGVVLSNSDSLEPRICSDDKGGAIISWWDIRGSNLDIYAQRINSNGIINWTIDGIAICTAAGDQVYPEMCSDGNGGAIITWLDYRSYDINGMDIYAQRVNSSGIVKWNNNGRAICTASRDQGFRQIDICSTDNGGAILTWTDERNTPTTEDDIYAQRITLNGNVEWGTNGKAICAVNEDQFNPKVCPDGTGGAIFTWEDTRGADNDIFVQRVDSDGNKQWSTNGLAVCRANYFQRKPKVCPDGTGGGIIAWGDFRNGDSDIYAMRIRSGFPSSNHPLDIITYTDETGAIDWVLQDDFAGGEYRVLVNDSEGYTYIWRDWTSWVPNTHLNVPIDRNVTGVYLYTIEYFDNHNQTGSPDTVQISIWEDLIPYSNHPEDITMYINESKTINWVLYDENEWITGRGYFRVLANNSNGDYYTWIDWSSWINGFQYYLSINRTMIGIYNYTIEYYDNRDNYGIPDTVIVNILPLPPEDNEQPDNGKPGVPFGSPLTISLFAVLGVISLVILINRRISRGCG